MVGVEDQRRAVPVQWDTDDRRRGDPVRMQCRAGEPTVIGFHAHQCIEKALKAVLTHADVAFRRTHDIAELLDLLHDVGRTAPPFADSLEELNPYAIEARYGLVEPAGLDRKATSQKVEGVIDWAEKQLTGPTQGAKGDPYLTT